jgi:nucleoside 2-deoxyribosyltransferase
MTFRVYTAGDMKSGWQDKLRAELPASVELLDPRSHGLKTPAAYTAWDLGAIEQADAVVAFMGPHNPSGYGLMLECGFAHALRKPIVFVDLMLMCQDWRSPHFEMLRSIVTKRVWSFEDAAAFISKLRRDVQIGEADNGPR